MVKEGLGPKPPFKARKIAGSRPRGPCRVGGKPLYRGQLMVLIRSRIESGPPGTRSFLLPERTRRDAPRDRAGKTGRTTSWNTASKTAPKAKFDPGYDRSNDWLP